MTNTDTRAANTVKLVLLTILLGICTGIIIWCFLKGMSFCTELLWQKLPDGVGNRYLTAGICAVGGLVVGLLHKKYGDYPEELPVVLGKIQKNKHYDYHSMFGMLLCAFFPLVLGSSVGPEAGLTGIIAALCYWMGDNVKFAGHHAAVFSEVGKVVSLSHIFHSPLFGILSVEEGTTDEEEDSSVPKMQKILLYVLATAVCFFIMELLGFLFGKALTGLPRFSEVEVGRTEYFMLLVYIAVGLLLYLFFVLCEKVVGEVAKHVPIILKETICGIAIGVVGIFFPIILFSGEEGMTELMSSFGSATPLFLLGVCLLKVLMTVFCLKFGMKGGHFFPLIYACTCMGYAVAIFVFNAPGEHVVFAAGIVTATVLGAQLKKPLATASLLLICYPVRFVFWLLLSSVIGSVVAQAIEKKKTDAPVGDAPEERTAEE